MIVCNDKFEGLIFDKDTITELFSNHKIFCKLVGVSKSSKTNSQFVDQPYLCDRYSLAYIHKNKLFQITNFNKQECEQILSSKQYKAYEILKAQYYLINGSKFGALFLAYQNDPLSSHADYLVFIQGGITMMSRMATISKKKCMYLNTETQTKYLIDHITQTKRKTPNVFQTKQ